MLFSKKIRRINVNIFFVFFLELPFLKETPSALVLHKLGVKYLLIKSKLKLSY